MFPENTPQALHNSIFKFVTKEIEDLRGMTDQRRRSDSLTTEYSGDGSERSRVKRKSLDFWDELSLAAGEFAVHQIG